MDADFPAAHSMNTDWFAVDADGRVGLLRSGALGHAPEGAEDGTRFLADLWRLQGGTGDAPRYYPPELIGQLGLFCYDYSGWREFYLTVGTYTCHAVPSDPLHIDQLPPQIRSEAQRFRLDKVLFPHNETIQPLEFYLCDFRYKESRVAYFGSDGRTVRPIPGREDTFREYCEELRREHPEQARGLHFEGLDTDEESR
jgi:hypothetical protein